MPLSHVIQNIGGTETVACPVFGNIPLKSCLRNRRRKDPPVNFLQMEFARHCPNCANNTDSEGD